VAKRDSRIDLQRPVDLLHEHLTQALSDGVWERTRDGERDRIWGLHRLVEFWVAVVLRAPASLTQALEEQCGKSATGGPGPSSQGFFARCGSLRREFFEGLFEAFSSRVMAGRAPCFAREHAAVLGRFRGLWLVDGSRLDAIAHRLKVLWKDRSVVLPGALVALYDLGHGVVRALQFDADAAASEHNRAVAILDKAPRGTLLMGDRLYGTAAFFSALSARGLWGLTRYNKTLGVRGVEVLSRRAHEGGVLEDRLVDAGSGQGVAPQRLRLITWRKGRTKRELLTNVLDPAKLSAQEALALYPERWKIERLFFDLKEVLNLHCFYAANPNAVAMQVYAAAIVHTALRVAQAEIAAQVRVAPEELSVPKLFPRVAAASEALAVAEIAVDEVQRLNPGVRLKRPDFRTLRFSWTTLEAVRVAHRKGPRRARRFCRARAKWKSLRKVPGAPR
jgi:hypothetical protein